MVEGFFRFCHAKSLFNVQLGGMRMDVKDKKEMEVWKNYIEPALGPSIVSLNTNKSSSSSSSSVTELPRTPLKS